MRTVQGNTLRALHNVQGFLNENANRLGGVISTGSRAMLDTAIAELEEHAAMQDGRARMERGAVAIQRARRLALIRDHMAPIDRIARLLLADVPDLVALRLPKGRPTVERLVALAGGMAEAAEPHAEVFIRTGRKPTFITDLRAAADALLQALQDRYANRSKVRMATSGLQTGMSRARKVVNVLDVLVRSELANDPDLLAGWNLARHVSQPRTSHATEAASVPEASITVSTLEPPIAVRTPETLVLGAAAWSRVPLSSEVGVLIAEIHEGPALHAGPSMKSESPLYLGAPRLLHPEPPSPHRHHEQREDKVRHAVRDHQVAEQPGALHPPERLLEHRHQQRREHDEPRRDARCAVRRGAWQHLPGEADDRCEDDRVEEDLLGRSGERQLLAAQ